MSNLTAQQIYEQTRGGRKKVIGTYFEGIEKTYIGKVEALEVCLERNIDKLPRKGTETITTFCVAEKRNDLVIGKDEKGFYLEERINQ